MWLHRELRPAGSRQLLSKPAIARSAMHNKQAETTHRAFEQIRMG
jgi:hypothetical protein